MDLILLQKKSCCFGRWEFSFLSFQNSNFASVEYIDDITKELVDSELNEEVDIDEELIDISINLDYEDYVKEYILKQKYDSDKFKSGITAEFDEVIKIYKENYSSKTD